MTGFETAAQEITLVLFTTLAPSGIVGYCLMALVLLRSDLEQAKRLNTLLLMPFLVCLGGLVASATHLGNPDNALYVFARVGLSPLSTEVAAAVLFLGAAGLQWLYQFAEHARPWLQKALLAAAVVAGVLFLASIALAYSSRTVVTWYTPLVPLALVLNALVGGPLLALAGFAFSQSPLRRRAVALPIASFFALAANVVVYFAQASELEGVANGVLTAIQLAPDYHSAIVLFAVLCLLAVAIDTAVLLRSSRASRRTRVAIVSAVLLAFAGIFVMRFMFYMTHMTVGISL